MYEVINLLQRVLTYLLEMATTSEQFQELFSHKDVSTTMIYTHVLNRAGRGVKSPVDML
jgi:site-specific recombinase XerD